MPPKKKGKKNKNKTGGGGSGTSSENVTPRHVQGEGSRVASSNSNSAQNGTPAAINLVNPPSPPPPAVMQLSQGGRDDASADGDLSSSYFQFKAQMDKFKAGMPPGSLAEMGGAPKSSSADLSANPKYSEVNTLKEQGNQMWKIGVQEIACTAYSTAIEKLQTIVRKESPDGETYDPTQMDQEAKTLMSRLFSNRSNCFYLLDRFEDSLSDAQESFAIDPLFAKAWLRAAQACVKLVNFDKFLQGEKLAEGAVDAADKMALATPSTLLPTNALSSCSMDSEIEKIKTHADLAAQYLREGLRVEPANGTLKNVLANLEGKEVQFKLAKGFGIADLSVENYAECVTWQQDPIGYVFALDGTMHMVVPGIKTPTPGKYEVTPSTSKIILHAPDPRMPKAEFKYAFLDKDTNIPSPLVGTSSTTGSSATIFKFNLKLEAPGKPALLMKPVSATFKEANFADTKEFFAAVDAFLPSVERLKTLKPAEANATELSTYLYLVTKWGHLRERCGENYEKFLSAIRQDKTRVGEKWKIFESIKDSGPGLDDLKSAARKQEGTSAPQQLSTSTSTTTAKLAGAAAPPIENTCTIEEVLSSAAPEDGTASADTCCGSSSSKTATAPGSSPEDSLPEDTTGNSSSLDAKKFRASDLISRFAAELEHGRDVVSATPSTAAVTATDSLVTNTSSLAKEDELGTTAAAQNNIKDTTCAAGASCCAGGPGPSTTTSQMGVVQEDGAVGKKVGLLKKPAQLVVPEGEQTSDVKVTPTSFQSTSPAAAIRPASQEQMGCLAKFTQMLCGGQ
ncbi:unnamed protein product [Amoebophrya sp. A120]|nr:unnamed protein product [Amoebophrya sp. A120]|eukprot:GSA120T00011871001.1